MLRMPTWVMHLGVRNASPDGLDSEAVIKYVLTGRESNPDDRPSW